MPASASDDSDSDPALSIFTEPPDFRPATPPATHATHTLLTGAHETLAVRLVGHSPLWGHHLWHAARITSTYLEKHANTLIRNKTILELGAGGGLPSLVCALRGAAAVVVSDYPDPELISNLATNIAVLPKPPGAEVKIRAVGYVWGHDPAPLLDGVGGGGFDVLVLSDLLFNHSQHRALVRTVCSTMKKNGGKALVFFTPHRPWLYEQDMAFFDVARSEGLRVEKVWEERMVGPMFEEDPGDRELRRMVFGYEVRWEEGEGEIVM